MNRKQKGFTLIELLVVISIIGLLSTVVMTSLGSVRKKARDARRKTDLNAISLAMEQYYSQYGTYVIPGTGYNGCSCGWFNRQDGVAPYLKSVATGLEEAGYFTDTPRDPSIANDNVTPQYMKYQCGSGFFVYAKLEAPSAKDIATYTYSKSLGCNNLDGYGINYAVGHN
jgi:general secretion pathway protein G